MSSAKPGWRRPRLTMRGLMVGVAMLAVVFASIWVYLPWLRWRERVHRVIDKKLTSPNKDLFSAATFQNANSLTESEYRDVLRDPRYVALCLLEILERETDPQRRWATE